MGEPGRLPREQVPFPVTVPFRTAPGPRPLVGPPLVVDDALPRARARRLERLASDEAGVLVRDPVSPDDLALCAAVQVALSLVPVSVTSDDPLELARAFGLSCADDLVVLRRVDGRATAELLAVAFPSGWPPRRRAGADLGVLHAPVADGARLRAAGPALSEALLSKGPFRQHVWGFEPDGRLDRDPSAPDAAPWSDRPVAEWELRVETQTSVPLPHLGRALFLIRPHLQPLAALTAEQRLLLRDAVASMSPETLTYKGIATHRTRLLAELAR